MPSLKLIPFRDPALTEQTIIRVTPRINFSRPAVFVIPGFLTERHEEPHGLLPAAAFPDPSSVHWLFRYVWPEMKQFGCQNTFYVNWPSASTWQQAVCNAERLAIELWVLVEKFRGPVLLLGHSLGGRIVLRVCERFGNTLGRHRLKAIALAPAIAEDEVDWPCLEKYTLNDIEVFFSKSDAVLGYGYWWKQRQWGRLLGVSGIPDEYRSTIRSIDVTDRWYRRGRGHKHYKDDLERLLPEESLVWLDFCDRVRSSNRKRRTRKTVKRAQPKHGHAGKKGTPRKPNSKLVAPGKRATTRKRKSPKRKTPRRARGVPR